MLIAAVISDWHETTVHGAAFLWSPGTAHQSKKRFWDDGRRNVGAGVVGLFSIYLDSKAFFGSAFTRSVTQQPRVASAAAARRHKQEAAALQQAAECCRIIAASLVCQLA